VPAGERPFSRAELGSAVAELVRLDVDELTAPRWLVYVLRAAIVALLIALLHPNGPFNRPPAPPQLVAARDIPPYHVLMEGDISVLPPTAEDAAVAARRKALLGRYTTRLIRGGAPFSADAHADGAKVPGLSERRVATLRVIPPDASLSAALPAHATLTAAGGTLPGECADAWVLAITREAAAATALATAALPETCAGDPLTALLAGRAIAIVWASRP
jgi:hypothetical protein